MQFLHVQEGRFQNGVQGFHCFTLKRPWVSYARGWAQRQWKRPLWYVVFVLPILGLAAFTKRHIKTVSVHTLSLYSCCHRVTPNNSYLCTYDLYVRRVPKWHSPNGSMPFHRAEKSLNFQGPTPSHLPSLWFCSVCTQQKHYIQGRINHRCIGSFMYKSSHGSCQSP